MMSAFENAHGKQKATRSLLRAAAPDAVTQGEVQALRDRVLAEIDTAEAIHEGPSRIQIFAVACSVLIATVSMTTILIRGTSESVQTVAESTPGDGFSLARTDDGSLLFEFPDTRTRRITMSTSPKMDADETERVIHDKHFVDHSASPKPGSALFIRID